MDTVLSKDWKAYPGGLLIMIKLTSLRSFLHYIQSYPPLG